MDSALLCISFPMNRFLILKFKITLKPAGAN